MRIRLHGTPADCEQAVARLAQIFDLEEVSAPHQDRGRSVLVRVYLTVRLHGKGPALRAGEAVPGIDPTTKGHRRRRRGGDR